MSRNTLTAGQSLSVRLRASRSQFLLDVEAGASKQWTVVMGNESGDLDTIASSIALWWYYQTVKNESRTVPLIQTSRNDLKLRPENEYALSQASLDPAHDDLLCIDDVQPSGAFPAIKYALVDHNRLLSRFKDGNPESSVTAIIDHHEDEGLHLQASPRIVRTPVGSASSLVTQYIGENLPSNINIPPEIASLLLSAILIDTGGLKPDGKAEDVDRTSAAMLLTFSTFPRRGRDLEPASTGVANLDLGAIHMDPTVHSLFEDLNQRKNDVLHLDAFDLLKRDYKQYQWEIRGAEVLSLSKQNVNVGLSTVPLGLQSWLPRSSLSSFVDTVLNYMISQGIDILGILTTFRDESHSKHRSQQCDSGGKESGKHKRQLMLIFRSTAEKANQMPDLVDYVMSGLANIDSMKVLELEETRALKYFVEDRPDSEGFFKDSSSDKCTSVTVGDQRLDVYLFKQKNAKATRKIIAPLLKEIFEGKGDGHRS